MSTLVFFLLIDTASPERQHFRCTLVLVLVTPARFSTLSFIKETVASSSSKAKMSTEPFDPTTLTRIILNKMLSDSHASLFMLVPDLLLSDSSVGLVEEAVLLDAHHNVKRLVDLEEHPHLLREAVAFGVHRCKERLVELEKHRHHRREVVRLNCVVDTPGRSQKLS